MTTELKVEMIPNANIHYTKEALIPLLELPLVENLDSNDGRFLDHTEWCEIDDYV